MPPGLLPAQRRNELEADELAVRVVARAGFDPAALVAYVGRVQPPMAGEFSALPGRDERVTAMKATVAGLDTGDFVVSSGEFVAVRERMLARRTGSGGN